MSQLRMTIAIVCSTFSCSLFVVPCSAADKQPAATARPNFIVFIADDMAWDDCGAYGHPHIRTPNIDRLADEGMRFDNAYLTCSSCSPSRASLITGRYPHNTGAHQLHSPLPADQITFVELLKASGYYTAAAGKWHMGNATKPKFDRVQLKMNRWADTLRQRPRDKPFFMWFAFTDPHRPYQQRTIRNPHSPADVIVPPYLPDGADTRTDLAQYYDEIARLDAVVGRVLEELKRQNKSDETVIVFLSDNGRPFPRAKTTVYDSGIKTPWIVRYPARVKARSRCASLISSIDLAPTLLELAGIKPPASFQGHSFVSLFDDPKQTVRRHVYAEHNWHDFEDFSRAVRSKRFKYIRNVYNDVPGTPPADAIRSLTFRAMLRLRDQKKLTPAQMNPFLSPRPREELYDVEADPHELHNLAGDSKHARTLADLRSVLARWQAKTNDAVPAKRRADQFDRETGKRLKQRRRRRGK